MEGCHRRDNHGKCICFLRLSWNYSGSRRVPRSGEVLTTASQRIGPAELSPFFFFFSVVFNDGWQTYIVSSFPTSASKGNSRTVQSDKVQNTAFYEHLWASGSVCCYLRMFFFLKVGCLQHGNLLFINKSSRLLGCHLLPGQVLYRRPGSLSFLCRILAVVCRLKSLLSLCSSTHIQVHTNM